MQRSSPLATPLPLSPSLPLAAVYNSSTLLLPTLGCRRVEELQEGRREGGRERGVARGLLLCLFESLFLGRALIIGQNVFLKKLLIIGNRFNAHCSRFISICMVSFTPPNTSCMADM